MQSPLRLTTRVLPGHRVEFTAPELPEGADVEVEVAVRAAQRVTQRERFAALAERWRQETAALSSVTAMVMHPAYQEIIGMGRDAVPWLLEELRRRPGHWFWALRAITGANPVRPEQQGRLEEITFAWLEWGRVQGLAA